MATVPQKRMTRPVSSLLLLPTPRLAAKGQASGQLFPLMPGHATVIRPQVTMLSPVRPFEAASDPQKTNRARYGPPGLGTDLPGADGLGSLCRSKGK